MEGPYRLLLVAGFLAAMLPAAAATFGPQPGAPCEPTLLASRVSLVCAGGAPIPECCETVLAAVNSGGGVLCLCRVATQPELVMSGLDATQLLTLYRSCGGLRPGGAHLAADCEGTPPPAAVVSSPPPSPSPRRKKHEQYRLHLSREKPQSEHEDWAAQVQVHSSDRTCDGIIERKLLAPVCEASSLLSRELLNSCGETESLPSKSCCVQVVRIIDSGCLCDVGEEQNIAVSTLNAQHLWYLYRACGGKSKIPIDTTSCSVEHAPPPPPKSPPPPPNSPSPPNAHSAPSANPISTTESLSIYTSILESFWLTIVFTACVLALTAVCLASAISLWRRSNVAVVPAPPTTYLEDKIIMSAPSTRLHEEVEMVKPPTALSCTDPARPQVQVLQLPSPTPSAPPQVQVLQLPSPTPSAPPQGKVLPPPSPTPSAPPQALMAD